MLKKSSSILQNRSSLHGKLTHIPRSSAERLISDIGMSLQKEMLTGLDNTLPAIKNITFLLSDDNISLLIADGSQLFLEIDPRSKVIEDRFFRRLFSKSKLSYPEYIAIINSFTNPKSPFSLFKGKVHSYSELLQSLSSLDKIIDSSHSNSDCMHDINKYRTLIEDTLSLVTEDNDPEFEYLKHCLLTRIKHIDVFTKRLDRIRNILISIRKDLKVFKDNIFELHGVFEHISRDFSLLLGFDQSLSKKPLKDFEDSLIDIDYIFYSLKKTPVFDLHTEMSFVVKEISRLVR